MSTVEDKSKERLKETISKEITKLFDGVLHYAELAILKKEIYDRFRSKVLRLGNNAIRACNKEIDLNYTVTWDPVIQSEDLIEIRRNG